MTPASAVLDTNVVLDWLVFREPSVAGIAAAVASGHLVWLTTAAMRDEIAHVLGRGLAAERRVDIPAVLAAWDAHARQRPPAAPQPALRCTDPDDQKFIDLACAESVRWLISRDRAVLKLARRAAARELIILTPEAWHRQHTA